MAVPPSPTLSARTTATTLGMAGSKLLPPHLVTRSDLRASLGALESLLTASKAYTSALLALGSASSELGVALEACSRSKGAHHVGSGLLATSGIHFMASNSLSILADAWWRETAIPLLEHHDMYTQACADRITQHERTLATKSKELNEAEARNRKEAKSKHGRDLGSFRRALAELQKRVDELDEEKARYYHDILESEEESWSFVQDKMVSSLRSQLDVYERISSKGLSDATLEPLLSAIADPFSAYGPPRAEDQIYSILSGQQSLVGTPGIDTLAANPGHFDNQPAQAQTSDLPGSALATTASPAGHLIMSPSTPSKGLSRSGAVSPPSDHSSIAVVGSNNGLGISLAAAATLARASIGTGAGTSSGAGEASTMVSAVEGTGSTSAKPPSQPSDSANNNDLDLFGRDGDEDEEGSIFSGAEEDEENHENVLSSSRTKLNVAKGRERAVRTSAAQRLKHALSIIDEGKTNQQQELRETTSPVRVAKPLNAKQDEMLAKPRVVANGVNGAEVQAEHDADTSGDERQNAGHGGDSSARPDEGSRVAAPIPSTEGAED